MKIRSDFVSNSSSTSFIVYICDIESLKMYESKFEEFVNEPARSDKLFQYAIVDIKGADQYLEQIIWSCDSDNSHNFRFILQDCHDLKFDDDKLYAIVDFSDLLSQYFKYPEYKDEIKNRCCYFLNEDCWDNNDYDECENYFENLQGYLKDNNIKYETQSTHV